MTDLLDIREAAGLLRVSETSLRRWTNAGLLPCLRIGGRRERRFRRADLLAFIGVASHSTRSPPRNHFCELYTSDLSRVSGAAAFLASGLLPHALCLLIAGKGVQQGVIDQMERVRPAVRSDLKAGRLMLAEYRSSAVAQLDFWRARIRSALQEGVSQVYVAGDVSAGELGRLPFDEILEYETEYGRSIAHAFPVTTLCQYDARTISGLDAARLLQRHHGPLH